VSVPTLNSRIASATFEEWAGALQVTLVARDVGEVVEALGCVGVVGAPSRCGDTAAVSWRAAAGQDGNRTGSPVLAT
jgi:hypothetical protein